MTANEMINEREAMVLTGLSRSTLYLHRKKGIVRWKTSLTGRKLKYNVKDLLKLI